MIAGRVQPREENNEFFIQRGIGLTVSYYKQSHLVRVPQFTSHKRIHVALATTRWESPNGVIPDLNARPPPRESEVNPLILGGRFASQ